MRLDTQVTLELLGGAALLRPGQTALQLERRAHHARERMALSPEFNFANPA